MSIKFDIWMDRGDADALDTFARERGMTRSAESRYIIMDYLKNKAPYNIKEDPQVMELREAVISLIYFRLNKSRCLKAVCSDEWFGKFGTGK